MAAQITLLKEGTASSITIKANAYPEEEPFRPRQKIGIAEGGGIKVAILGSDDEIYVLHWTERSGLTTADKNTLRTFVRTTVNWAEHSVKLTDAHAVEHTGMRFVDQEFNFRQTRHGWWTGTLTLRKDLDL